jgi:hypothetical protein
MVNKYRNKLTQYLIELKEISKYEREAKKVIIEFLDNRYNYYQSLYMDDQNFDDYFMAKKILGELNIFIESFMVGRNKKENNFAIRKSMRRYLGELYSLIKEV